DIEVVIDRLKVGKGKQFDKRLLSSIDTAMTQGDDVLMVIEQGEKKVRFFSRTLMDPESGISYPNPEPNTFSFNSPKGACPKCNGIGTVYQVNIDKIIPDSGKSIKNGGLAPYPKPKKNWAFKQFQLIAERYGFKLTDKIKDIPKEGLDMILYGGKEKLEVDSKDLGVKRNYKINFEGIANFIEQTYYNNNSRRLRRWSKSFMDKVECPKCDGSRLKKQALYFKINGKNIAELSEKDISELTEWFEDLPKKLTKNQLKIGEEIVKEIRTRLQFLVDVGLTYLALARGSKSLSGGEAQRIRLATQIGSQLVGVLYILDEPSIGLHQRDNNKLIDSL